MDWRWPAWPRGESQACRWFEMHRLDLQGHTLSLQLRGPMKSLPLFLQPILSPLLLPSNSLSFYSVPGWGAATKGAVGIPLRRW